MKKTNSIILGSVFIMAVASCGTNDSSGWTLGSDNNGKKRDTICNGSIYRYHGGGWYPVYNNGMIYPRAYGRGYNYQQVTSPNFKPTPTMTVPSYSSSNSRFGGFGSSAHSSAGE